MNNTKYKKLNKYLAIAGTCITSVTITNANIVYVDINPDHEVAQFHNTKVDEFYNIILNGDTLLRVGNFNSYTGTGSPSGNTRNAIWVKGNNPASSNNNALINDVYYDAPYGTKNDGYLLSALSSGFVINSVKDFKSEGFIGIFSTERWSTGTYTVGPAGNFNDVTDKYVGAKLNINGSTHYGWLRFTVGASISTFSFHDYAYQDCPNIPIKAGDQSDVKANTLDLGINVLNTGENPNDIEVSFSLSVADSTVSEYRLIAVKESKAATFSASMAKAVPSSSYISVGDSIISFSQALSSSTLDSDGDVIVGGGEGYRMFALSIPDGKNSNSIEISTQSDLFLNLIDGIESDLNNFKIFINNKILSVESIEQTNSDLSIVSLEGKKVLDFKINNNQFKTDLSQLKSGIYIVNVQTTKGETYSKKIVL